jgi:hypothetical protein
MIERDIQGFRTYTRAIDQLEHAADPVMLGMSDRHVHQRMTPPVPELPQSWREPRLHLEDPRAWYAGYLGVRGEVEIPWELRSDMRHKAPQANLRDVGRYVYPLYYVERQPMDFGLDPGGRIGTREAKEALSRKPLPVIKPVLGEVLVEQARRRRFLRESWRPFHDDTAPRVYREMKF